MRRPEAVLMLGDDARLLRALREWGLDTRVVDRAELLGGTAGGHALVVSGTAGPRPTLRTLAEIWSVEPELPIILLDDGDAQLRRTALRAGVFASVRPPHCPDEVCRLVELALDKRAAGAMSFERELARRMSTIAALVGEAADRDFLGPVLDEIVALFEVGRASIFLFDDPHEDERHLELAAAVGLEAPQGVRIPVGVGIAGKVAAEGIPQLLLGRADGYERFSHVANDRSIAASLCIPIRAAGERGYGVVLGVLNLARTGSGEVFTPRDLEVCELLSAQIGQALSRLELNAARADLQQKMVATEKLAYAGEVAAGIAHEVANPISYIKSNLRVLREYLDELRPHLEKLQAETDDEELREVLTDLPGLIDESAQGADRATRIVDDMKAMVRLEQKSKREPVALPEVVSSALHLLRPRLANRCPVEVLTDEGDLVVEGNEIELSQTVVNLVVNAFDACLARRERDPDHQPLISVEIRGQDDACALIVRDNGTGISPRDQARIFAPLFTTKPTGVGTGLGLGIVKRIVTAHGGSVKLSSTPGVGTSFCIWFPRPGRAEPSVAPSPAERCSAEPMA